MLISVHISIKIERLMKKILKTNNLWPSVQNVFHKNNILTAHNKIYRISKGPNVLNSIKIAWKT
jgi:hypothetical protein